MATNTLDNSLNRNGLNNDRGTTAPHDAFIRLRWSIFEDVSTILVLDDPRSQNPSFSPFVGHAIAAEPASQIPLTEIAITNSYIDWYDHYDYESPEPLLVSRADGGTVTVADVVEELSAYFTSHREDIFMVLELYLKKRPCRFVVDGNVEYDPTILASGEEISPDTKVLFNGFFWYRRARRGAWSRIVC
ncbi:hypothetical protein AA0113_g698 [Alternaria arborescens]|uniref:Uncharacterized protein n=1 Tax=Alternaria arborescens TaxID=156630 RepID=A0A4Q4SQ27_9PLEO|nr:hypothetical protein AA0111_g10119 [Alternaria arborescens]RYN29899.1 hypothetical protein AA0112_g7073 [Alternaria arborescens]RYO20374.1 hypothetical protein AA0111_g10119 [Alternaria arborescens]RYO73010.1 hypothetical protein AA0113_g698 [Alternaria arborescens]